MAGGAARTRRATVVDEPTAVPLHAQLYERLSRGEDTFWGLVYEPFIARDLTRHDLRELVRLGLEHTRGNYKLLVRTFNMPPGDYKRFLNFLRKYRCHVPFQAFRTVPNRHDTNRTELPRGEMREAPAEAVLA